MFCGTLGCPLLLLLLLLLLAAASVGQANEMQDYGRQIKMCVCAHYIEDFPPMPAECLSQASHLKVGARGLYVT
jgi:hypothetical protein